VEDIFSSRFDVEKTHDPAADARRGQCRVALLRWGLR
jgi:hypothetical protein